MEDGERHLCVESLIVSEGGTMTVREILLYPENDPALRRKSEPVRRISQDVRQLIEDLKDTLLSHPEGVGLAAPQIHVHKRVVVVRLGADSGTHTEPGEPLALVNPVIIDAHSERKDFDGCLSIPGIYGETTRPHYLNVVSRDERGKTVNRVFEGFDAVVVHHEIDHLEGILFIDRIERWEDLYQLRVDEKGQVVRVPVSSLWRDIDETQSTQGAE